MSQQRLVGRRLTGIELPVLIGLCIYALFFTMMFILETTLKGNYWYSDEGVLEAIQLNNPNIDSILKSTRNITDYSVILTKDTDNSKHVFYLETDIFTNYRLYEKQQSFFQRPLRDP